MRAVFRVDASPEVGTGHLSRCLTLARALRAEGFDIEIATVEPSPHTAAWIAREGCRMTVLEDDEGGVGAMKATRAAVEGASLVVLDGYGFRAPLHEALRRGDRLVCVIDDLADAQVGGDVVLNGNLYGEELSYDVREGAVLLCGPSYALVRQEFVAARERRLTRDVPTPATKRRARLLVTMGGADPTRETEKATAALSLLEPMSVRIVVGGANPRAEAIESAAGTLGATHDVDVLVDVRDMGEQMVWCDLALTASGSTCLELACVGVPAAAIVVADNQRRVADALERRSLMDIVGESEEVDARDVARALTGLRDPSRAREMERLQRACIDGRGAERAAGRLAALVRERVRA